MNQHSMNRSLSIVLIGLTPVCMILSFPDFNLSFLAWMAFVPFLYLVGTRALGLRAIFFSAVMAGTLFFSGTCYWVTYSMINYGGLWEWSAYGLALIIALTLGAFWGPFAVALQWAVNRLGIMGLLLAAPLWTLSEWSRYELTKTGWNAFGYSQAFQPSVIQIARLTGVYGVSFLLVGASSVVAVMALGGLRRVGQWSGRMTLVLLYASLLLLTIGGAWLSYKPVVGHDSRSPGGLRILGLQPDVPIEALTGADSEAMYFDRLVASTESELASTRKPDLVIWPESPLNISLHRSTAVLRLLRGLVQLHRVYLLLNVIGETPPNRFHNSVAVFNPKGEVISEYHKIQLLPFGEYVPLRGVLPFIDQIPALAGDFSAGHDYRLADIGKAKIGSFICSESADQGIPRQMTLRGATLLVEVTNDLWFGPTSAARQHLAHSIFRAVENHRHLIRVTNSGISADITPTGGVIGETELFKTAIRHWTIPGASMASQMTFYTRYGDLFVLACSVVSVGVFLMAVRARLIRGRIPSS